MSPWGRAVRCFSGLVVMVRRLIGRALDIQDWHAALTAQTNTTGTRPLPRRPRVKHSESGERGEPGIKEKKKGIYLRLGNG